MPPTTNQTSAGTPGTPDKVRKALYAVLDRLTDQLRDELHMLLDEAPAPIVGRAPSEQDLVVQQQFKDKAVKFLKDLPPESGITYQTVMKQVEDELAKRKKTQRISTNPNAKKATTAPPPPPPSPGKLKKITNSPSPKTTPKASKKVPKKKSIKRQSSNPQPKKKMVDYLCLLDFMATCNDGPPPKPQEIIEFPAMLLNVETGEVEGVFHSYIKPDVHQQLSEYCIELTGITQHQVDSGISLVEALDMHQQWLNNHGLISLSEALKQGPKRDPSQRTFIYTICGDWDLKVCLPNQLEYQKKKLPMAFQSWINIKWPFENIYHKSVRGIADMLSEMGLAPDSSSDSGLDDCRNLAHICQRMIKHGWTPNPTTGEGRIGTKLFWEVQSRRPWPPQPDPVSPYKMIYLIRHGESEANIVDAKERLSNQALKDCGLTDRGVEESKALPELLGDHYKKIELVVTSPLKRALQTAVIGFPQQDIVVNYDLMEIGRDAPENSPKAMDEVLREIDKDMKGRDKDSQLDYESLMPKKWPQSTKSDTPSRRIQGAFEWIYMDCREQTIAVVCHNNLIRSAIYGVNAPVTPEFASPIRCQLFMNGNLVPI